MNAFRYLGYKSFDDVDDLLISEYMMLMRAHRYNQLDEKYKIHLQSYLSHAVKATKTVGKRERSIYPTFEDFFNYEEELRRIDDQVGKVEIDEVKMKMLDINTEMNEVGGG